MTDRCYRRFNNGTYLLTCELNKGHGFHHMDGEETWEADQGFSDEYDKDGFILYTPPAEPPDRPEVVSLEEAIKDVPKFYKGVKKLSITERLAERKLLNASLTKKTS